MSITFYHNPQCSKSRAVSEILLANNIEAQVVEYMNQPFSAETLHQIIAMLDAPAAQLVRTGDARFAQLGIDADALDEKTVVEVLLKQPALFQRPVVVANGRARIGRPPEQVLEILT